MHHIYHLPPFSRSGIFLWTSIRRQPSGVCIFRVELTFTLKEDEGSTILWNAGSPSIILHRIMSNKIIHLTPCVVTAAKMPHYNIVTCQPFVGLRNKTLLGNRPVNKVPRRRGDVTQQRWNMAPAHSRCDDVTCVYVVARRWAAILSDCKGSGRHDVTVLLNNAMTVARDC
jgi:hypothetical protein